MRELNNAEVVQVSGGDGEILLGVSLALAAAGGGAVGMAGAALAVGAYVHQNYVEEPMAIKAATYTTPPPFDFPKRPNGQPPGRVRTKDEENSFS